MEICVRQTFPCRYIENYIVQYRPKNMVEANQIIDASGKLPFDTESHHTGYY
jgi:hypothetical protein